MSQKQLPLYPGLVGRGRWVSSPVQALITIPSVSVYRLFLLSPPYPLGVQDHSFVSGGGRWEL